MPPIACRLRISRRLPHPAQHRPLRDLEAEHPQLAMNSRRSPRPILGHHAEDEFAQFPVHALPACTGAMPREPLPVQLESGTMPADNRLRLHENQCTLPSPPEPPQHHPEQFVCESEPWLLGASFQDCKLLPEGQILQEEIAARAKESIARTRKSLSRRSMKTSLTQGLTTSEVQIICLIQWEITILARQHFGAPVSSQGQI